MDRRKKPITTIHFIPEEMLQSRAYCTSIWEGKNGLEVERSIHLTSTAQFPHYADVATLPHQHQYHLPADGPRRWDTF